jgi:hypothetical protein
LPSHGDSSTLIDTYPWFASWAYYPEHGLLFLGSIYRLEVSIARWTSLLTFITCRVISKNTSDNSDDIYKLQDSESKVGLAFLSATFIGIKSIPGVYHSAIRIPDIMLINVLACRLYRNIKFGIFRETTSDFVLPMENLNPDISPLYSLAMEAILPRSAAYLALLVVELNSSHRKILLVTD